MNVPRLGSLLRSGAFTALLLAGSMPVAAQNAAVITGRVVSERGDPLGGATVVVANSNWGATTAANGTYTINVAAASARGQTVTLTARYLGFRPQSRSITLSAGTQEQNFTLAADPLRLDELVVTGVFFVEHAVDSPRSWLPDDVPADARYPLLVKVREGFGSRHIYRAETPDDLRHHLERTPVDSFVQEVCRGEEFSIYVFCDLDGRCLNAIPRTMIQSKGGESIKGRSTRDPELIAHGARVAETVGIVGPTNVQCFREPDGSLPVRSPAPAR